MYKNVAGQHTFAVVIEASTGNPKTSGVDFYITKDDGVQAAADSSTHVGNGQWRIAFTQAETNADVMGLSWSGADVVANGMTFYTVTKKVSDLNDAAAAPSAATIASQVRTELGTELGRIDAAISSRNATTPPTAEAIRTELEGAGTKLTAIHAKLPATHIADDSTLNDFVTLFTTRLTAARAAYLDKLNVSGTLAHSDAANTYKATVSGLATSAEIANLHNFNPASDKVIVVTNEDKTGYELTSGERTNIAASVWATTTRTLSSFGSLVADVAAEVWGAVSRTITGTVTVGTNNDKTGYALATPPPTAEQIRAEIDSNSGPLNSLFKRFFNKVVKNTDAGTLVTYEDDGTTVHKSQTFTSTETTDTINKAT